MNISYITSSAYRPITADMAERFTGIEEFCELLDIKVTPSEAEFAMKFIPESKYLQKIATDLDKHYHV